MSEIFLGGIDIGGTKCAASIAIKKDDNLTILEKSTFPTPKLPFEAIKMFEAKLDELMAKHNITAIDAMGVSCGSPINSEKGIIMEPPNLKGWVDVDIITPFKNKYTQKIKLENDANAGALAEWQYGAGKGYNNLIFLTFGTGMGAGLILNGRLYSGKNDSAGEVGHMRIMDFGPEGYGKHGSFEGFCSGGGIAQLGKMRIKESIADGVIPGFCKNFSNLSQDIESITTKIIGDAAENGDPFAIGIFEEVGTYLGLGLSVLIDILNPEIIIMGSIFNRQHELLEKSMKRTIEKQALRINRENCKIVPAGLDDKIGDYAALSIASLVV